MYTSAATTGAAAIALTGLLDQEPDMVVSGINAGANMGDDTVYSGTVAAATEGYLLGIPAIAVSLVSRSDKHFETAAQVARRLVRQYAEKPLKEPVLLNVNVPDLPLEQIKGIKTTRLGNRHRAESVICTEDPRGQPIYWIGPPGSQQDAGDDAGQDGTAPQRPVAEGVEAKLRRIVSLDELAHVCVLHVWFPQVSSTHRLVASFWATSVGP